MESALPSSLDGGEAIVVDGLLGTGSAGAPRGDVALAIERVEPLRARGAAVVALDVPSGVDASTGDAPGAAVTADLTLTFGTVKRGQLVARDRSGAIVVLDIGLGAHARLDDGAPQLVDERVGRGVRAADWRERAQGRAKEARDRRRRAGDGRRRRARRARGAPQRHRHGEARRRARRVSRSVQESEPQALAAAWPADDEAVEHQIASWADAVVIGPGLGRDEASRALLERVLRVWTRPDAARRRRDHAVRAARASNWRSCLGGRPALITPHPVEFARLAGVDAEDVLVEAIRRRGGRRPHAWRGRAPQRCADGHHESQTAARLVSASGTPALATGGSGDVLSGIAGTLLAQLGDPFAAGAAAAWVHGRAAERVPMRGVGQVRGISLDDVVAELRDAWTFDDRPARYPVLAELPAVGDRR